MTNEQMLEIFKQTGGMLKGHFKLTSGRHSDTYMQCAKLFTDANASEMLCKELAKKLDNKKIDLVISPAVGGILMGYEVSRHLHVKNVFAERENGEMTLRRGFVIEKGQNVLVVEDVVTTGGSVKEVVKLVEELGGNPIAVASIVDRSNGKVDFGIPFYSLLSMDIVSYDESECPLCKQGLVIVKPGSRDITKKK